MPTAKGLFRRLLWLGYEGAGLCSHAPPARPGLSSVRLQLAAQWHTTDLLDNRALDADVGSDGSTPQDRAHAAGYPGRVAETVALNPALAMSGIELINQWYYNPAYLATMRDCACTQIGVWSPPRRCGPDCSPPHLRPREVAHAFVVLGAGDTFSVIRQLINFVSAKRIPLRAELMQLCGVWLESYAHHEQYEPIRRLVESVMVPIESTR